MVTSRALDADIHAHPDHFPRVGTARVRLFHLNDIPQFKLLPFHLFSLSPFYTTLAPDSVLFLALLQSSDKESECPAS